MARTPMNEKRQARWFREFDELGAEKVRGGMVHGRWEKEKRSAARQWLERRDAREFQAVRPVGSAPKTFFMKQRSSKWWVYVAGGALLILGLVRVLKRL